MLIFAICGIYLITYNFKNADDADFADFHPSLKKSVLIYAICGMPF